MVTDINDKNPEFVGLPYEFSVKEGEARKLIGRVHAEDADEGVNAEITYFAPDDIPFTVDPETGDVLTKIVLDYEQNNVSNIIFPLSFSLYSFLRNRTHKISPLVFLCKTSYFIITSGLFFQREKQFSSGFILKISREKL